MSPKDTLARFTKITALPTPVSRGTINLGALRDTPPGTMRIIRDDQGNEWALMPLEDLQHVLSLAGLKEDDRDPEKTGP